MSVYKYVDSFNHECGPITDDDFCPGDMIITFYNTCYLIIAKNLDTYTTIVRTAHRNVHFERWPLGLKLSYKILRIDV